MNKKIKETPDVKNVEQLKKIIDRYGARQEELKQLSAEQKSDKQKIEEFAHLNNINYQKANYYKLSMKADDPRLLRKGEITASTDTTLTLGNGMDNGSAKPDSDWQNQPAKFVLKRNGVEYPYSFTFLNA